MTKCKVWDKNNDILQNKALVLLQNNHKLLFLSQNIVFFLILLCFSIFLTLCSKIFKIKYKMTRAIITVVGKDTVGIIAKVCTYLADNQINILDISQTIVQDFFNMMMIVDMTRCEVAFEQISVELSHLGDGMGVQVKCQLEDIFDKMHRI